MENKVLGKGLSALIPKREISSIQAASNFHSGNIHSENKEQFQPKADPPSAGMSILEINLIDNNRFQPRKHYDESKLEELKASIKEKGVLQPILVRPVGERYEVVAGERRLRASRLLGLMQIPAIIKNITDREAIVLALVENIQREELNPIEEAQGFKRLIEEFQFTQETVAGSVGKDRSTITNLLRLLKLPTEVQADVAKGILSVGHARCLISLNEGSVQKKYAQEIVKKGLSVRQTEALVKKILEGDSQDKRASKERTVKDRELQILEEELSRLLGTKVFIEDKNNRGKLMIEYYSLQDFDRILGVLRK